MEMVAIPLRPIVLGVVLVIGVVGIGLLLESGCGRDESTLARSPDGTYRVVVRTEGCGATTANTTTVDIAKANWLRSRRTLYHINPGYGHGIWAQADSAPARFRWVGDTILVVEPHGAVALPPPPARLFDVAIRHEPTRR